MAAKMQVWTFGMALAQCYPWQMVPASKRE